MALFKLNQLLIENDEQCNLQPGETLSERQDEEMMSTHEGESVYLKLPASTFTIKVIKIFKELTANSNRLALKLFQMIFATKQFLEKTINENDRIDESSQNKLSKKLQYLILTCSKTKTKSNDSAKSGGNKKQSTSVELEEQYNSLFYFYLKLVKLLRENDGQENQRGGDDFEMIDELYPNAKKFKLHSDGSSKSAQPELNLTNQKVLCINIFEFLFNLFRKIKNSKENPSGSEKQMIQLMSSLMSNFNYLHSIHYLSSNSTSSSNEKLNNDLIVSIKQEHDDFLSRAFFYNLNLIHSELILHLFRLNLSCH